jgi:Arc/MetJ family transcription regulator
LRRIFVCLQGVDTAHSRLCNYFCNAEDRQKGKQGGGLFIASCLMRTNIVIDDNLINEAISLTGIRTKRELVNLALQELVTKRKKKDLFKLAGQIEFRDEFNHK